MSFNHRMIKHESDNSIGIYEIFYSEDGSIKSHAENPIIVGNDLEDLQEELKNIENSFYRPMLTMNASGEIKE